MTCSEEGCERPVHAYGLCTSHYFRRWRAGTLPRRPADAPCVTEGCTVRRYADDDGGRCFPHWLDAIKGSLGWAEAHPDGLWPWERDGTTPAAWGAGFRQRRAERIGDVA